MGNAFGSSAGTGGLGRGMHLEDKALELTSSSVVREEAVPFKNRDKVPSHPTRLPDGIHSQPPMKPSQVAGGWMVPSAQGRNPPCNGGSVLGGKLVFAHPPHGSRPLKGEAVPRPPRPTPHTPHPTPHTPHPTPHAPRPTPRTPHPTPHTQHQTPNTQHPTTNTQHPTPQPSSLPRRRQLTPAFQQQSSCSPRAGTASPR